MASPAQPSVTDALATLAAACPSSPPAAALKALCRASLEASVRAALAAVLPHALAMAVEAPADHPALLYVWRLLRNAAAGCEDNQLALATALASSPLLHPNHLTALLAPPASPACAVAYLQLLVNVVSANEAAAAVLFDPALPVLSAVVASEAARAVDGLIGLVPLFVVRAAVAVPDLLPQSEPWLALVLELVAQLDTEDSLLFTNVVHLVELAADAGVLGAWLAAAKTASPDSAMELLKILDGLVHRAESEGGDVTAFTPLPLAETIMDDLVGDINAMLMPLAAGAPTAGSGSDSDDDDGLTGRIAVNRDVQDSAMALLRLRLRILGMVLGGAEPVLRDAAGSRGLVAGVTMLLKAVHAAQSHTVQARRARNGPDHDGSGIPDGLLAEVMRLVANAAFESPANQDEVRETDGMMVILDCCKLDERNPYLREWALMAVRNLTIDNTANQEVIAELETRGIAPGTDLDSLGIDAEIDEHGKLRVSRRK
ncbi:ataxin 10 [Thecamonas trahens ATCC 50062]|uniref:Ataxin 10 n=1 Tax=Thecamonas trahens ATCC 50062 TaxID=461836 RepID=A0A0L0DVG4_THETB|nr:ataxin 10 [Thecamonas trahens ATCC 50062]KNC56304.1 ataxin 10 [Thecamonas trahens ATCC 50062]|eukprot:XP_013760823.1 ataxin 10 [Thecamonas trahens ATCC 50062]